ncbi:tRNA pseudouridine(55) synthase TruB [Candidatus Giovannonibacteria bacterium]|nr:tRNA pseudouridine(55) synthase TruB [Candidatus Giovannonibacteria bacterium]
MDGFILLNKPSGPTSHDVVQELRVMSGISQIGHAGTLDPLAEGLLILLVGNFTKKSFLFAKLSKEYRATLRLGLESDSHDAEGEVSPTREFVIPLREDVESALEKFRGKMKQVPPQFSAVKSRGRKAYKEARAGREVKLEPRTVVISKLETVWYKFPILTLDIACSSGTYIRSIARDLGEALGTGAILTHLRRTQVGPYRIEKAADFTEINSKSWMNFLKVEPLPNNFQQALS